MAWKEVVVGDATWSVAPVAERVANAHAWRLVLSCRCAGAGRRSVWASTGLQSTSRSDLYALADRLSDDRVKDVLARHLEPVSTRP
jgi:hypothetical protein